MMEYLSELKNCTLCEWKCGVDRLKGEFGVCETGIPIVASKTLHPAPPKSFTIFMEGCNFRCLNCQNWDIAHGKSTDKSNFIEPADLAAEGVKRINSYSGKMIGADRFFFSGGSPTPSLPYIERVVEEARKIEDIKVNFDTNGFMTKSSLKRVLEFTTSITFDIKAYHDDVHRAITGASVEPVLRNAEYLIENAMGKLWEIRYLLIPGMNEKDVIHLSRFLSEIDSETPLNFLAFRPNFIMENYKGAGRKDLEKAVKTANDVGLKNVSWSGLPGIEGEKRVFEQDKYTHHGAKIAGRIAEEHGCVTHPRDCKICPKLKECQIKSYKPSRRT